MGSVTLSANEVLIMKDEGVGCQSTSIGVLRAVTSRGVERGTLVLTNKSLIFSPDKSIFSKKEKTSASHWIRLRYRMASLRYVPQSLIHVRLIIA